MRNDLLFSELTLAFCIEGGLYRSGVDTMPKQTFTRQEEISPVLALSRGRQLNLSRPLVMGILNVTPDSFSDGNVFNCPELALERGLQIQEEGADIIDIGGESSRPGAIPIDSDEEQGRVLPVLKLIRKQTDIPISIDTYRSSTASMVIDEGADIINDISALRFDKLMGEVIAKNRVLAVLMHMLGTPSHMQVDPSYKNCIDEINNFFVERIDYAVKAGIDKSKIILDPGIGFGKRLSDNLEILARLREFRKEGLPLLIGASRKSFINMLNPIDKPPEERIGGSVAAAVTAVLHGASIVRVHDVKETVEALKLVQAVGGVS